MSARHEYMGHRKGNKMTTSFIRKIQNKATLKSFFIQQCSKKKKEKKVSK